MNQIICVHVGDRYTNDYVEKLHRGLRKHSREPFLFTILNDGKSYDIDANNIRSISAEIYPFVGRNNRWWYKMQAFRNDVAIEGQNMLIDIDTVVVGDIDKFWHYQPDRFVIIQDFNRQFNPGYARSNSSVIKFTKEIATSIDRAWLSDPVHWTRKYRGDQDWFDGELKDMARWPSSWVRSWKWEVFNGGRFSAHKEEYLSNHTVLDPQCSIIAFHGKPDPHEVEHEMITQHWV